MSHDHFHTSFCTLLVENMRVEEGLMREGMTAVTRPELHTVVLQSIASLGTVTHALHIKLCQTIHYFIVQEYTPARHNTEQRANQTIPSRASSSTTRLSFSLHLFVAARRGQRPSKTQKTPTKPLQTPAPLKGGYLPQKKKLALHLRCFITTRFEG